MIQKKLHLIKLYNETTECFFCFFYLLSIFSFLELLHFFQQFIHFSSSLTSFVHCIVGESCISITPENQTYLSVCCLIGTDFTWSLSWRQHMFTCCEPHASLICYIKYPECICWPLPLMLMPMTELSGLIDLNARMAALFFTFHFHCCFSGGCNLLKTHKLTPSYLKIH